jgi:hypothetical protein
VALLVVCGVTLTGGTAVSFERSLDLPLINAAAAIGESRIDSVRARFHQPYRIAVARPPVDLIEVLTPFRQVVRLAEERSRAGSRPLNQQDMIAALGDRLGLLEVAIEFTFHPLNAYVGVPPYAVGLVGGYPPVSIAPVQTSRVPRFGARVQGTPRLTENVPLNVPGSNEPLLGGTVVAGFDAAMLDPQGTYEIVVSEAGKELARARTDLGSLR